MKWTREKLRRFKAVHKRELARHGQDGSFIFEGNPFLVAFAGYLIEYLETRL